MSIQTTEYDYPPAAPCPCGDGGNTTIVNQDEDDIATALYENTPVRYAPNYSHEDDSTVSPAFRRPGL